MIAILSGGVGAAKFARGVASLYDPSEIRIISNTGDDEELHGLHISPDIDTVIYTLAGAINKETGWGLEGETWRTMDALSEYGGITWFKLGDKDLATHMFRTQLLRDGENLTQVTDKIRSRWGVKIRVLPVTNDPLKTVLYCNLGGSNEWLSFQEYFVKYSHSPETLRIQYNNAKKTRPTPEVIETIQSAEVIFIAPSNPLLSIGPILAVSDMIELLQARRESVVAISPIIGGKAVKGPAAKLMGELGLIPSSLGVAQYYKEVIDSLVIDTIDAHLLSDIRFDSDTTNLSRAESSLGSSATTRFSAFDTTLEVITTTSKLRSWHQEVTSSAKLSPDSTSGTPWGANRDINRVPS